MKVKFKLKCNSNDTYECHHNLEHPHELKGSTSLVFQESRDPHDHDQVLHDHEKERKASIVQKVQRPSRVALLVITTL